MASELDALELRVAALEAALQESSTATGFVLIASVPAVVGMPRFVGGLCTVLFAQIPANRALRRSTQHPQRDDWREAAGGGVGVPRPRSGAPAARRLPGRRSVPPSKYMPV